MGTATSPARSVDGNSITGQPYTTTVAGTYCLTASGPHTMTLQSSVWGPATFAFVLNSGGNGRIMEYDDTTGQGSRGTGELRKASSSAFSLSSLNGNWVFGMTGAALHSGGQVERFVDVGQFALASGQMTGGTCDINDGGSFQTCTFSGNVSSINAQTGRGTVSVQSSNGASNEVVYVVSSGELVMASLDSVPNTQVPLSVGLIERQSGSFNNGSLSGTGVLIAQDIHGADGRDQSAAGIVSLDGHGNFNITAMDEDLAGTITQDPPEQGTYTVLSNGALTFNCQSGGCPAGFLFAQNKGMFVGTGSSTLFGQLGPQSGGPFSNASISGNYFGGSLAPLDYLNANNELDVLATDGAGSLTMNGASSGADGLDQYFGGQATYNIAANGRGTAISPGDQAPAIVYVISPSAFVVMMPKSEARIDFFQH